MPVHIKPIAGWAVASLGLLIGCFLLAWLLLARFDFAYPAAYHVLDIDQTIAEFGPQNRYRNHFAATDTQEHYRLFGAIVTAVHRDGRGLEDIVYRLPDGRVVDRLLHEEEILHLNDVAQLISGWRIIGSLALLGGLLLAALLWWRNIAMPSPTHLLYAWLGGAGVIALGVLIAGPVRVFYALHELLFPPEHPWFFYYQDSLMSTLMQAPNLFGFIAIVLTLVALLLFAAMMVGLHLLMRYADSKARAA